VLATTNPLTGCCSSCVTNSEGCGRPARPRHRHARFLGARASCPSPTPCPVRARRRDPRLASRAAYRMPTERVAVGAYTRGRGFRVPWQAASNMLGWPMAPLSWREAAAPASTTHLAGHCGARCNGAGPHRRAASLVAGTAAAHPRCCARRCGCAPVHPALLLPSRAPGRTWPREAKHVGGQRVDTRRGRSSPSGYAVEPGLSVYSSSSCGPVQSVGIYSWEEVVE
jgi:hypothetical protein